MYEAHLRSLLSPLGIYDLEEHSASGAAVCALEQGWTQSAASWRRSSGRR